MSDITYYEIEVAANRRTEHIPEFFKDRLDKIQELAIRCDAGRGDMVELVKCVAPARIQVGPITGPTQVIQHQEAQRTTIRRWTVTRARDMQMREV
jgi:hypothetical protein